MKKLLLLCLCLSFVGQLLAQFSVTGTLTNEQAEPLVGVNVSEKGTIKGTVTDFNGAYQIDVADENAVLIFSYVGYETIEVPVDANAEINVTMKEGVALGEVQVVGSRSYKRSVTDSPVLMLVVMNTGRYAGESKLVSPGRARSKKSKLRFKSTA